MFERCRLEIRDTADWKSALRLGAPRATPAPILRSTTDARRHWIIANIPRNARMLFIVAHPMVEWLRLPESSFGNTQQGLGTSGAELFTALYDLPDHVIRHWPEQNVNVIGHHDPLAQEIALLVKKAEHT